MSALGGAPAGCCSGCPKRAVLQDAPGLAADLLGRDAQPAEHIRRGAFGFPDEAQEQVLGADVLVAQFARFLDGVLDDLLGAHRKLDALRKQPARRDDPFDHLLDPFFLEAELAQDAPGHAAFLLDQSEEQVFGADLPLVQAFGFLMGEAEYPTSPLGKAFQTVCH